VYVATKLKRLYLGKSDKIEKAASVFHPSQRLKLVEQNYFCQRMQRNTFAHKLKLRIIKTSLVSELLVTPQDAATQVIFLKTNYELRKSKAHC